MVSRHWKDIFWLVFFWLHLVIVGCLLGVAGVSRFRKTDGQPGLTEQYWPLYSLSGVVSIVIGWIWLLLLGSLSDQMMKVYVHIVPTYVAVLSVLCFWDKHLFSGVALAIGAGLLLMYIISLRDRLPFTMLVLQRAVKMICKLPEVMRVASAFMLAMLIWLALWAFGVSRLVAFGMADTGRRWLLGVFSLSLSWTGAVFCNTVHCIASGMSYLVLLHGARDAATMPQNPLLQSVRNSLTTSFGSICYGSIFTAPIRTLRWEMRGLRSKIGKNECLVCCIDFMYHLVEFLVRMFNKYAYVQIAVNGKDFNSSARDAWELFQSTGVEALIAYDCSGGVLLINTVLGGLITGTCAVVFTRIKHPDGDVMMGYTALLMGIVVVGLAMVVVESAITSIYVCYAEDPSLIQRWDSQLFDQMSEMLHERLQHRSAREGIEQATRSPA